MCVDFEQKFVKKLKTSANLCKNPCLQDLSSLIGFIKPWSFQNTACREGIYSAIKTISMWDAKDIADLCVESLAIATSIISYIHRVLHK